MNGELRTQLKELGVPQSFQSGFAFAEIEGRTRNRCEDRYMAIEQR